MKNLPHIAAVKDLLCEDQLTECCLPKSVQITAMLNLNFFCRSKQPRSGQTN